MDVVLHVIPTCGIDNKIIFTILHALGYTGGSVIGLGIFLFLKESFILLSFVTS